MTTAPPDSVALSSEISHSLVASVRLGLAATVMVAYLIDIPGQVASSLLTQAVIAGYLLYSLLLYVMLRPNSRFAALPYQYWVDIAWYGVLTAVTDPGTSGIFMFYLFAILVMSFRHGTVAGVRITFGSAALYLAIVGALSSRYAAMEWAAPVLRSFFLISLGCLISIWGGSELTLKRRLALLREISAMSNPRFGTEQALGATLDKLRSFFRAEACILVVHDPEHDRYLMRELRQPGALPEPQALPADMARLLLRAGPKQAISFGPARRRFGLARMETRHYDLERGRWLALPGEDGADVAGILNTAAFASVPLQAGNEAGRIYLTANRRRFRRTELLFFAQAAEQAFRQIEYVRVLDRMASAAAAVERQRIVTDLHDTAIQPYIGLKLGLEALRRQARSDNPVSAGIDGLLSMTSAVIGDLRTYVRNLEHHHVTPSHLLTAGIRERAERLREDAGVQVDLELPEHPDVSDRLAAEILQLVNEGLSNVRKHTRARSCKLKLWRQRDMLVLQLANPHEGGAPPRQFVPRSIAARARALGGRAEVDIGPDHTTVRIAIPT